MECVAFPNLLYASIVQIIRNIEGENILRTERKEKKIENWGKKEKKMGRGKDCSHRDIVFKLSSVSQRNQMREHLVSEILRE